MLYYTNEIHVLITACGIPCIHDVVHWSMSTPVKLRWDLMSTPVKLRCDLMSTPVKLRYDLRSTPVKLRCDLMSTPAKLRCDYMSILAKLNVTLYLYPPWKIWCDLMSTLSNLDVTICQPWQNWMWPYVHPGKTGCALMSTLEKLDVTFPPALSRMTWDHLSSSQHPTHPVMGFRGTLMTAWFFLFRPFGQPPAVLFIFLSWITETQS